MGLRRGESGAAILEFAIVFVFFLCLTAGILDCGFLLYQRSILRGGLNAAVEEVARSGASGLTEEKVGEMLAEKARGYMQARSLFRSLGDDLSFTTHLSACSDPPAAPSTVLFSAEWRPPCLLCIVSAFRATLNSSTLSLFEPAGGVVCDAA